MNGYLALSMAILTGFLMVIMWFKGRKFERKLMNKQIIDSFDKINVKKDLPIK